MGIRVNTGTVGKKAATELLSGKRSEALAYNVLAEASGESANSAGMALTSDELQKFLDSVGANQADVPVLTVPTPNAPQIPQATVFTPQGGETVANQLTPGFQTGARITYLTNGKFVLTWVTNAGASPDDIQARIFNADGTPFTNEFTVNANTAGNQAQAEVAALAGGGFAVVWFEASITNGDLRGRVYDAAGTALTGNIAINDPALPQAAAGQVQVAIVGLSGGRFAVTWADNGGPETGAGASVSQVRARVFEANGTPVAGSESQVNTTAASFQHYPAIAKLGIGYVVVWHDNSGAAGASDDIRAQLFDLNGARVGTEILVTSTSGAQSLPSVVDLAGGGFAVAWTDPSGTGGDTSGTSIKARIFTAAGVAIGSEFLVNATIFSDQSEVALAQLPDGGFVATWSDNSQAGGDTTGTAIRSRAFDANGVGGTERLVNTTTAGAQNDPAIAADTAGNHTIAFVDFSTGTPDIRFQRFSATAPNVAPAGTDATLTINEDTARVLTVADFGFTDTDGNALLSVGITTLPAAGTIRLNGTAVTAGTFVSAADINAGLLVYTPGSNGNGVGYSSFTFQVRDNGGSTDTDLSANTITFDVTAVNDAPTIANLDGFMVTQVEDGPQNLAIAPNGIVIDSDSANFDGGVLTVAFTTPYNGTDTLALLGNGIVSTSGQNVLVNGVVVGTVSGGATGFPRTGTLTVAFNADATVARVQEVVKALFVGDQFVEKIGGTRTLSVTLTDGDGGTSPVYTGSLVVTAINDEPSGTDNTITINEDAARALTAADFGFLDTTTPFNFGEGDTLAAVFITTLPTAGTLYIDTDGAGMGALGTAVVAGQRVTVADINGGRLVYVPVANANGAGAASFTFQVQDNNSRNGTGPGSQDTDQTPNTLTVNVTAVNDAPTVSIVPTTNQTVSNFAPTNGTIGSIGDGPRGYYGQTFKATGTTLSSIEFQIDGQTGSGTSDYTVVVAEVTFDAQGRFHPGAIVYQSNLMTFTGDADNVFDTVLVNTGGLVLTPGASYVFLLNTNAGTIVQGGNASAVVKTSDDSVYPDGTFVYLHDNLGSTTADFASNNWFHSPPSLDMAFRLQFGATVPGFAVTEQQAGTLKGAITLADIDAGSGVVTATLSVGYGVINATAGTSGATIVSGNGTGSVVVSGTLAQLNALLNTDGTSVVTFTANTDTPPANTTLNVSVNDNGNTGSGGAQIGSASQTITITAVNDAPAGTDAMLTINEDIARVLTVADFGFTDVDGHALLSVGITTLPAAGILRLNGTAVTAGTFVTAADINAGLLVYTPGSNGNGPGYSSFTFQVRDNSGSTDTDLSANTLTFNVTAVNDAPVADLNGAAAGIDTTASYTEDGAVVSPITGIVLSDVDNANLTGATVTIATGFLAGDILRLGGSLSGTTGSGITYSYNAGTGVLSLSGSATVAAYQTALATLAFKTSNDNPGTARNITVVVNDGAASSVAANIALTVTATNDAPVVTISAAPIGPVFDQFTLNTSNGYNISSFVEAENFTLGSATTLNKLNVFLLDSSNGLPTFDGFSGTLSFAIYADNGSGLPGTLLFTGSDAAPVAVDTGVDAFGRDIYQFAVNLGGIALPAGNYWVALHEGAWLSPGDGSDLYWMFSGNDTTGNAHAISNNTTAPDGTYTLEPAAGLAFSLVGPPGATEQVPYNMKGRVTIADADAGSGIVTATLSVGYGILKVNVGTSGATVVSGSGTSTVVVSGTVAQLNALLNTDATSLFRYIADTDAPPANTTLTVSVNDNGNTGGGGAQTGMATQTINITPVNDAPVADLNGAAAGINTTASYTEDGAPVSPIAGIVLSDADNANLTGATVTIATGFLAGDILRLGSSLSGTTGSGITYSYNSGTGVLTLSGSASVAAYQAALATLAFKTSNDNPGTARNITVVVNDGAASSVAANIALTVTAVNDAPVADLNGAAAGIDTTASYTEGGAAVSPISGIVLSDADNANLTGATVTIATGFVTGDILRLGGSLSGTTGSGITYSYNSGTGILSLSGSASVAAYQTALASLAFKTSNDDPGTARDITVVVNDGAASSVAAHIALTVTPVNDAPVNTVPSGQAGVSGNAIVFSAANGNALSVSDADAGSAPVQVKLNVDHGTLTLASTAGLTVIGDGTGSVKITGTLSAINAALDGLSYQGAAGYVGADALTIATLDLGNSGSGGPLLDTDSVAITLASAVSQAPSGKGFTGDMNSDISGAFATNDNGGYGDDSLGAMPYPINLSHDVTLGTAFLI